MRRSRLLLYFALALSGLVYSGSNAWAQRCAVQLSVHPYATVFLWGRPIAHCVSGAVVASACHVGVLTVRSMRLVTRSQPLSHTETG